MATQTWRISSVENDGAWVEFDYSDVNPQQNIAFLTRWANTLPKPVNIKVTLNNGKVVLDDTLPPAGVAPQPGHPAASGTFVLSGADRFNVTVEAQTPTINLAPWSTPTVP